MNQNMLMAVNLSLFTLAMAALPSGSRVRLHPVAIKTQMRASATGGQSEIVPYKFVRKFRLPKRGNPMFVVISVEPTRFVREEITRLAQQLNRDFSEEPRLWVEIMDDERIAQHVPPAGEYYGWYMSSKRGEYHLNRSTGVEYIQFSTTRKKPWNQVTLNLGRVPAKRLKDKRQRKE